MAVLAFFVFSEYVVNKGLWREWGEESNGISAGVRPPATASVGAKAPEMPLLSSLSYFSASFTLFFVCAIMPLIIFLVTI